MKLRYFLRGLGAGIVFTVMVLGLSNDNVQIVELTDNEIMARARALGMVTKEEQLEESLNQIMEEQTTNNEQTVVEEDEVIEDMTMEEVATEEIESEDASIADNTDDMEDGGESSEVESVLPEPYEEEETQIVSKVTISPGMSSKQVAAAFLNVGLISDAEAFDDYLCNHGYSSKIRVGTFTIEGKPDYAGLAKIITTKP